MITRRIGFPLTCEEDSIESRKRRSHTCDRPKIFVNQKKENNSYFSLPERNNLCNVRHHPYDQCGQIGQFLKAFGDNFYFKSDSKYAHVLGSFGRITLLIKTYFDYFVGNICKILATFIPTSGHTACDDCRFLSHFRPLKGELITVMGFYYRIRADRKSTNT